jgi:ferric-dicitrate binding protein FerR (iron transport regulator)
MPNVSEEAARWFAVSRRGLMLQEERAEFERWKRDPGNAARLTELRMIWEGLDCADAFPAPDRQPIPTAHRRQFAAMVAFVSLTAVVLTHIDDVWWNSLDWWSR